MSAALILGAATLALLALQRLQSSISVARPGTVSWQGDYWKIGSFLLWTLGDTTEPGYAHSALAGALMLIGAYTAHRAFLRGSDWTGFPVTSGTGLFGWIDA